MKSDGIRARIFFAGWMMFALLTPRLNAQLDMPLKNQKPEHFKTVVTKPAELDYLLFLPQDYKKKGGQRWPLLLFLHGAGERGHNLKLVTRHGPPKIVESRPDFQFIVVSPQCPTNQIWSDDSILALLDHVTKKYAVDANRVYLTGLSMGGYGTWSLGLTHPERFAAIVPICGGGNTLSVLLPDKKIESALKTLPVWAFHGGKDPAVNPEESKRMVAALHAIGNEAKLTIYEQAGHDSWTQAYNDPQLYAWLLQQDLRSRKKK